VIFLDSEFQVKRYTEPAKDLINLIEEDIGRPIDHFSTSLQDVQLQDQAALVMDDLRQIEKDVQDQSGRWYRMHVMPYRTVDNVIEGVVFTFTDIHDQKEANKKLKDVNRQLRRERELAEEIIKTVRNPLLVLNEDLQVVSANPAFYDKFSAEKETTVGKKFYEIKDGQWNIEELRKILEEILPEKSELNDFEIDADFAGIGEKKILLNAREIATAEEKNKRILLSIEDLAQHEE
jgi:PAS domain-containing protein